VPLVVLRAWREADERATDGADVVLRDPVATRDVDPDGSKGAMLFGEVLQRRGHGVGVIDERARELLAAPSERD
jgi:hypothetical protein